MTDLPPTKAIPYDELLALVYRLEAAQEAQRQTLTGRILELEQRVNDLTADLAQHEAAPYPHVRYTIRDLGVIVADGLDAALADYDVDAQTDGPDAFERLSSADSELTAEQCARIWQRVLDATAPEYTVDCPDEVQP